MATVEDAIRLLTDPANLLGIGRQYEGDYAVLSGSPVLRGLQGPDVDVVAARGLVREALAELRGLDQSYDKEVGGNRAGQVMRRSKRVDVYWVPRAAMRDAP